jgi:hypothetical protein
MGLILALSIFICGIVSIIILTIFIRKWLKQKVLNKKQKNTIYQTVFITTISIISSITFVLIIAKLLFEIFMFFFDFKINV